MSDDKTIIAYLPNAVAALLGRQPPGTIQLLEEVCLKPGRPVLVLAAQNSFFLTPDGGQTQDARMAYRLSKQDMQEAIERITGGSYYAIQDDIKAGFVTVEGGHRIGLCGKVASLEDKVLSMTDIGSLNYRIARQIVGCADSVLPCLIENGQVLSTLVISPPRCGKTTLLRDLTRSFSNGIPSLGFPGAKVAVSDERNEISACVKGIPQLDVGVRTDVMVQLQKAEAMTMLIRSMAPQILVTDEIGTQRDAQAITMALSAGVSVIASVHGLGVSDVMLRKNVGRLIREKAFRRLVILSRKGGKREEPTVIRNEGASCC